MIALVVTFLASASALKMTGNDLDARLHALHAAMSAPSFVQKSVVKSHKVLTYKDLVDARAKSVSNRQKVRDIQHRLSLAEASHTVTKAQPNQDVKKEQPGQDVPTSSEPPPSSSAEDGLAMDLEQGRADVLAQLNATKEACAACEVAENALLSAYETSLTDLNARNAYATALNEILAAKAEYQKELGEFDKQPLLDAIDAFKDEVEDFSPEDEPLVAKDFTGRVETLNEAAAEIKKLKDALDKAIDDGKPSCGGLECTQEGLEEMGVDESLLEKLREERDTACADVPKDKTPSGDGEAEGPASCQGDNKSEVGKCTSTGSECPVGSTGLGYSEDCGWKMCCTAPTEQGM
jgi:hypothetical protein